MLHNGTYRRESRRKKKMRRGGTFMKCFITGYSGESLPYYHRWSLDMFRRDFRRRWNGWCDVQSGYWLSLRCRLWRPHSGWFDYSSFRYRDGVQLRCESLQLRRCEDQYLKWQSRWRHNDDAREASTPSPWSSPLTLTLSFAVITMMCSSFRRHNKPLMFPRRTRRCSWILVAQTQKYLLAGRSRSCHYIGTGAHIEDSIQAYIGITCNNVSSLMAAVSMCRQQLPS